ncbi:30S ribosomal protein S6 [Candidatus Nomurabacteria bacterium]|nr:30S ribosomal protein S6 [Candidatus Nomurabacteria bacterium]
MARSKSEKYEIMVALKPLLPDDVRKSMHKEVIDLVKDQKGEVDDVDVWGKRYLAYEIEGHNEGYYILYQASIPAVSIAEIKRQLGLKQEILRFMIIRVDDPAELKKKLKKKDIQLDE